MERIDGIKKKEWNSPMAERHGSFSVELRNGGVMITQIKEIFGNFKEIILCQQMYNLCFMYGKPRGTV